MYDNLEWTPEGRRARGRPKTTWRRTVLKERENEGWRTWNEAKVVAKDRDGWGRRVEALCAYWRGETRWCLPEVYHEVFSRIHQELASWNTFHLYLSIF